MTAYGQLIDTILETEEFVTPEEYLRRRELGEINPAEVRYAMPKIGEEDFGGFMIKLKQPRYKANIKPISELEGQHGW